MKSELTLTLKWDVKLEPIMLNSSQVACKKALLRNDNDALLGIVGKDYHPVTNYQLMGFTEALTKTGEFELKGFDEINNGKTILAFLQNKNQNLKLNGCAMKEYLIIGNSHDGTRPLYIGTGSSLIRCENQFYSTIKVFRKKHTSPVDINNVMAENIIQSYKRKKSIIYEAFDGMESIRIDQSTINRLVKEIHKMIANDSSSLKQGEWGWSPSMRVLRNCIERETGDLGNNAFGLFNGVTWYTSHEMRNAGSDFGRLNGTANLINQKAYRFCNNLKRAATEIIEFV